MKRELLPTIENSRDDRLRHLSNPITLSRYQSNHPQMNHPQMNHPRMNKSYRSLIVLIGVVLLGPVLLSCLPAYDVLWSPKVTKFNDAATTQVTVDAYLNVPIIFSWNRAAVSPFEDQEMHRTTKAAAFIIAEADSSDFNATLTQLEETFPSEHKVYRRFDQPYLFYPTQLGTFNLIFLNHSTPPKPDGAGITTIRLNVVNRPEKIKQRILFESLGATDCDPCGELEHAWEKALADNSVVVNKKDSDLYILNHHYKWRPGSPDPYETFDALERLSVFNSSYSDDADPKISNSACPDGFRYSSIAPRWAYQMDGAFGQLGCGHHETRAPITYLNLVTDLRTNPEPAPFIEVQFSTESADSAFFKNEQNYGMLQVGVSLYEQSLPLEDLFKDNKFVSEQHPLHEHKLRTYNYTSYLDENAQNGLVDLLYTTLPGAGFEKSKTGTWTDLSAVVKNAFVGFIQPEVPPFARDKDILTAAPEIINDPLTLFKNGVIYGLVHSVTQNITSNDFISIIDARQTNTKAFPYGTLGFVEDKHNKIINVGGYEIAPEDFSKNK